MRQNHLADVFSTEEIGIWSSLACELERLRDTTRHSEETFEERMDALMNTVGVVNQKLDHLERNFDKKHKTRAQKLYQIRKDLEQLGNEPPALRKEAFNLWWARFNKVLQALVETVPDEEL